LKQSVGYEMARDVRHLPLFTDGSRPIYLENNARGQIGQEELHTMETIQILRDYDN